jgi:sugar phosphate isomerase/epimerase
LIPFKLGVITDEISHDLERALDVMLEYDIRQVELRELWGKNVLKLDGAEVARARALIADRGMSVCSVASPFYKCSLGPVADAGSLAGERKLHGATETVLAGQMDILKRAMELAHEFGTRIIRVFAFWREAPLSPTLLQTIQEMFKEPVRLAAEEGLILGLENEHACMLGTASEAALLLQTANHPNLRCVWDPGNAFQLDERPFPDGYNTLKEWIVHVHVKDARRVAGSGGKVEHPWTVVGAGDIDFAGQFRALVEDGYSGVVSLETHYRNPAGDAESSSRECLDGIRRILEGMA